MRTDGINMSNIFDYDGIIDLNRLYTNDVHAMASMYGIEAATTIIVNEIQDVFKVSNIEAHNYWLSDYIQASARDSSSSTASGRNYPKLATRQNVI